MLVFYIYDYSPVCPSQMCEVDELEWLTLSDDVAVVGVSTDGPYSHRAFIADNGISYPLLSDVDRTLHEDCGMLTENEEGYPRARRGVVVLDGDLTIRHHWTAADNWDAWNNDPLREARRAVADLTG